MNTLHSCNKKYIPSITDLTFVLLNQFIRLLVLTVALPFIPDLIQRVIKKNVVCNETQTKYSFDIYFCLSTDTTLRLYFPLCLFLSVHLSPLVYVCRLPVQN